MADKKIWTDEHFSDLRKSYVQSTQQQIENDTEESIIAIPDNSGLAHTQVQRPFINYGCTFLLYLCDKIMKINKIKIYTIFFAGAAARSGRNYFYTDRSG